MRRLLRAKHITRRAVPGMVTVEKEARPPLWGRNHGIVDMV